MRLLIGLSAAFAAAVTAVVLSAEGLWLDVSVFTLGLVAGLVMVAMIRRDGLAE